jgi:hypothetical protein
MPVAAIAIDAEEVETALQVGKRDGSIAWHSVNLLGRLRVL